MTDRKMCHEDKLGKVNWGAVAATLFCRARRETPTAVREGPKDVREEAADASEEEHASRQKAGQGQRKGHMQRV